MIAAEKVTFRAGARALVHEVNFQAGFGEVVVLVGPNGAGKSTLLKILCGQVKPSEGEVRFENRPLAAWPLRELARRRAVLPQHCGVPFDFTALEIVLLGRSPYGDAAGSEEFALSAMEETDCRHLARRVVTGLSGGELQRVHLARVLVQLGQKADGSALLLDEPISSLDPAHQHRTLRVARRLAGRGAAVVVVLHDLNLAAQYADRLAVMKDGVICAEGKPGDILTADLVDAVFGIRARMVHNPVTGTPAVFVE